MIFVEFFDQYRAETFLLGRLFFGAYMVERGLNHFLNIDGLTGFAANAGVPMAEIAVIVTGALLLLGGLSIAAGLYPHWGVILLAVFFIGVTPVMHQFWADPSQLGNFVRNVGLLGAAIAFCTVQDWDYAIKER